MTRLDQRLRRQFNGSLSARIVMLVLALLLVLQVASFGAIRASLQRHAFEVLPKQLAVADNVLQSLLDAESARVIDRARLVTSDYGFLSTLLEKDADDQTLLSAAENLGKRLGTIRDIAYLRPDFSLQAYSGDPARPLIPVLPRLKEAIDAASTRPDGAPNVLTLIDGRIVRVLAVPIKAPAPVLRGWVVFAHPVDQSLVDRMQKLSSHHLTLLTRPTARAAWSPALSTLPPAQAGALAQLPWAHASADIETMREAEAIGERLAVVPHWLSGGNGRNESAEVLALLTASIDEAVKLGTGLQLALLTITLIGFAAFSIGSVFTARYVTNPLRELARAAERLGGGDFQTPMPRLQRSDEIGELATTFERMRHNVADKQAQVEKLAYWDPLTGLPNRVQFSRAVGEAIDRARTDGHSVAVLMLDLDRFKHVNDVLGYRLGDLLLIGLADRLKSEVLREGDLVARLGGDEFAVLLRQGDETMALTVAERITRAFDEPMELEEHTVDMHAGIGMACWPQHANDVETLLSRAEVAMYTAKRRTAGPLLYEAAIDAGSAQTLSLLSELRHAVDHGELRLYLQPKLALANGEVVGAETLVRWMHPTRGMVPPMQFIPFAEQTGFIRRMTVWIFEEAARHWRALRAEGITLTLSVNLSTRDLLDQDLPQKFGAMLLRHQVPSTAFCLEITESAIMDDPQRALATLERLSEQGFRLSIDDFGTGYSSLAYLKRLPVDELKIDKSFVMSMETDLDDRKIVRSTIDLAHNLGLTVVAEGVENATCWDLLRELNCDQAQGYHMGRPMPAGEFGRWAELWMLKQAPGDGPRTTSDAVLH